MALKVKKIAKIQRNYLRFLISISVRHSRSPRCFFFTGPYYKDRVQMFFIYPNVLKISYMMVEKNSPLFLTFWFNLKMRPFFPPVFQTEETVKNK